MDEAAYRQKFSELMERPCTFEKALLAGCVGCSHVCRVQIAEREAISCRNASSLNRCTSLHDSLRHNFAFALGLTNVDGLLDAALQRWGDMAEIPYSEVVHAAALNYKGRHG